MVVCTLGRSLRRGQATPKTSRYPSPDLKNTCRMHGNEKAVLKSKAEVRITHHNALGVAELMQGSQRLQMPQWHTFHSSVTFSEGQVTFSPSFSFSVLRMKMND